MVAQAGQDVLIKLEDGLISGNYIAVAGIRAKTIQLNAGVVHATHTGSSGGWRELLSGAGVKSVRVSGSGVFRDEASDTRMRNVFMSREAVNWKLIIPDFADPESVLFKCRSRFLHDLIGDMNKLCSVLR